MIRLTYICKILLIINVVVFLAAQLPMLHQLQPLMLYSFGSTKFLPFQVVTYAFMHGGFMHILFNMLGLVMIGGMLENLWGPKRFLIYYMTCAVLSGLFYMGYNYYNYHQVELALNAFNASPSYDGLNKLVDSIGSKFLNLLTMDDGTNLSGLIDKFRGEFIDGNYESANQVSKVITEVMTFQKDTPMVGASGAIYGLMIAIGAMMPDTEFFIMPIPIPIKAKYLIPAALIGEYFFSTNAQPGDNVAHVAHIGGAICGAIVLLFWYRK